MLDFIIPLICVMIFGVIGLVVSKEDPSLGAVLTVFGISVIWHLALIPDWMFVVSLAGIALFVAWKFIGIWR